MGWGDSANVVTTNLDAGTDSPASARSDIKNAMDELSNVIDGLGTPEGAASLGTDGKVPTPQLHHSVTTSFPVATSLDYGYRVFRSDMGQWFTLMNATLWGGTGKVWVSEDAETLLFGLEGANGSDVDLDGPGGVTPTSSSVGYLADVGLLISSASVVSSTSFTGTAKIKATGVDKVSLSLSSESTKAMSRAAASWVAVDADDIVHASLEISSGTATDPIVRASVRTVYAA